jgi:hypothetical protein
MTWERIFGRNIPSLGGRAGSRNHVALHIGAFLAHNLDVLKLLLRRRLARVNRKYKRVTFPLIGHIHPPGDDVNTSLADGRTTDIPGLARVLLP